jgi:hypothetical protein
VAGFCVCNVPRIRETYWNLMVLRDAGGHEVADEDVRDGPSQEA